MAYAVKRGGPGRKGGNGPSGQKPGRVKRGKKIPFYFIKHIFKSNFKSNSNSFVNFNQTKASQNKYVASCMHKYVCRPILDINFNKVIIF